MRFWLVIEWTKVKFNYLELYISKCDGAKWLETRKLTLQHIQNIDLNELKWNFGGFYNFGQN